MQRLAAVPASASPYGANGGQPRGVRSDGGRLVSWAQLNSTPPPRDGTARCADTQCRLTVKSTACWAGPTPRTG